MTRLMLALLTIALGPAAGATVPLKVLTYNLWHGYGPTSFGLYGPLEPRERLAAREKRQLDVVSDVDADLGFFQEFNPISRRAFQFAMALGSEFTYQLDAVGLKFLGLGVPMGLNAGLLTTTRFGLRARKVAGLSLDRRRLNAIGTWASFQTREERFALLTEIQLPDARRVLLINAHVHDGLQVTPEFEREVQIVLGTESHTPKATRAKLRSRLLRAMLRRVREVQVLLEYVQKLEPAYDAIIMAGDFNATPGGFADQLIEAAGFRDVWAELHPDDPGFTFDAATNPLGVLMQSGAPPSLNLDGLKLAPGIKAALITLAEREERKPRRLDYVWIKGRVKARSAELIGHPDAGGLAPSDHLGLAAELELN